MMLKAAEWNNISAEIRWNFESLAYTKMCKFLEIALQEVTDTKAHIRLSEI